jgi:hypothetical protein
MTMPTDEIQHRAAEVATLPRRAIQTGLSIARWPLSAAESVTGKRGTTWPPAVAFATLESLVLGAAGRVLGDETLAAASQEAQTVVSKARRASRLQEDAEQLERDAEATREQARTLADEQRTAAEEQASRRADEIEAAAGRRKHQARKAGRKRQEQVRSQADEAQQAIEEADRLATLHTADELSEALADERTALAARAEVMRAEEATKRAREARARG